MDKIRALRLSLIAIVSVVIFEMLAGVMVNSLAILSDAAHATFDSITTLILLVTTQWALKPPDEEHTYGHGKIESVGGLVGGIALIAAATFLVYESFSRLIFGGAWILPKPIGFMAVGYTLFIDFLRVITLSRTTEKSEVTVRANLYHALGDMASTTIALAGFYLATVAGLPQGDAFGSIILSVLLAYLSIGLLRTSGMELSDAISKRVITELHRRVDGTRGVLECKGLKARKVGSKYFVDTTVVVSERIGIKEAHEIATKIESNIASLLGDTVVTVHVEPSIKEESLESKIENLASAVEGVEGVHGVSTSYSGGSLYVTLHAQVDGKLSLDEAHRIAERIEQALHRELDAVKITVHLEPFDQSKVSQKCSILESNLEDTIRQLIDRYPRNVKIKALTTFVSGERRYINLDLVLNREYSIEEAHRVASRIERELKKRFEKTTVTIHSEPSQKASE